MERVNYLLKDVIIYLLQSFAISFADKMFYNRWPLVGMFFNCSGSVIDGMEESSFKKYLDFRL